MLHPPVSSIPPLCILSSTSKSTPKGYTVPVCGTVNQKNKKQVFATATITEEIKPSRADSVRKVSCRRGWGDGAEDDRGDRTKKCALSIDVDVEI